LQLSAPEAQLLVAGEVPTGGLRTHGLTITPFASLFGVNRLDLSDCNAWRLNQTHRLDSNTSIRAGADLSAALNRARLTLPRLRTGGSSRKSIEEAMKSDRSLNVRGFCG
jgi:hypothetical protein